MIVDGTIARDPLHWRHPMPETTIEQPQTVVIPVPDDFGMEDALKRLASLIAAQLLTGMRESEIAKRLHGHIEREGG